MEFPDVPGRAFLDTSVVNFTLDHGEQIYDGAPLPENLSNHATRDINALHNISLTGQRAVWQFAISPLTYKKVMSISRAPDKACGSDGSVQKKSLLARQTSCNAH